MLISFSGLDGSGKTTQINMISDYLTQNGLKIKCMTMYDDISIARRIRTLFGSAQNRAIKSEIRKEQRGETQISENNRGSYTEVNQDRYRRDKNRKENWLVVMRMLTYIGDLIVLMLKRIYWEKIKHKIIIMDRYLYDSVANLHNTNILAKIFIKYFVMMTPKPRIAFLVDIDPHTAYERKPEYPPEYFQERAEAYRQLFRSIKSAKIITVTTIEETQEKIRREIEFCLSKKRGHLLKQKEGRG